MLERHSLQDAPAFTNEESAMSASPGKSLLLRVNTSGSTFVTAGGMRTKQVKRAASKVDVTSADSAGRWRNCCPARRRNP